MQIDTNSQQMNEDEAEQLLETLYQMYHGRTVDDSGRNIFVPIIRDRGFMGLASVLDSVIQSDEMDDKVHSELENLWREHLGRTITTEELQKYEHPVRFFRQTALNEIISNIRQAESLRLQAAPYLNSGELDKARLLLDQAVTYEPAPWLVWHDHGLVRYRQEDYESAIPSYHKAIHYNPDNDYFWSCEDLKWCYGNLGEKKSKWYKEGLEFFQGVIEEFSERWIAYHECGWLLLKMREFDKAIPYYLKAIEKQSDPTWGWSYYDLFDCYESQNKRSEALEYFTAVAEAGSGNWAVWDRLGTLQWKHLGNPTKAVESFTKSTQFHPDGGWFWTYQSMGWCYGDLGQYGKAFNTFRRARAINQDDWHAWHAMGWAKEKLGDAATDKQSRDYYEEAIPFFHGTLKLHKKHVWTWIGLARCYRKRKEARYINSWEAYQYASPYVEGNDDALKAMDRGLERIGIEHKVQLLEILNEGFHPEELKTLCFVLGVPYPELEGSIHSSRVVSLIEYCERRGTLLKLIQQTRKARPNALESTIPE